VCVLYKVTGVMREGGVGGEKGKRECFERASLCFSPYL